MDVAQTRYGSRAKDRDELAIQVQNVFKKFLEEYEGDNGGPKYSEESLELLTNERNTLFIDFKDIEMFDSTLAEQIIEHYYRFYQYLCRAVASFVREEKMRQVEASLDQDLEVAQRMVEREQAKKDLDSPHIKNKDYYVGFHNFAERDNIRDLSSTKVGILTRIAGQVVRTHAVHPELRIGCFRCKDCLSIQYTEQEFRYTQPNICSNENCANRTRYELVLEKSRFSDFQRFRIQETQQELPRGCIPRSFDVVVRGADQMECIQPGDMCDFIGTLIACPDVGQMMAGAYATVTSEMSADSGVSGLKDMGVKEMTHTLAFLANACIIEGHSMPRINTDSNYREATIGAELVRADFTDEEIKKIEKMSKDTNLLDNLSTSLFSSVYGSEDVKRGIILQLLGGVAKQTGTGTKLRGDINICLVGDPSTAKSQFLKIVTDFAPVKAVYASGKASSASGLTAAVIRDTDGSFVIEAGALMLADRGICCIDEFDKMDLKDQVALHEAMEQQTISITKAGVTATLNARASILAAANPIGGTYNTRRDLKSNLSFSLPIMSRFDLFFTIIDPREERNDRAIARRIVDMHLNYANSSLARKDMIYTFEEIRLYLKFARRLYPKIPPENEIYLVQEYVRLRSNSTTSMTSWRITVRQLESLIRLSEAIARAYCKEYVTEEYIRMASRFIETTIVHVGNKEIDLDADLKDPNNRENVAADEPGLYEGESESQPLEPSQPTQTRLKIPVAEYKSMAQVLMLKIRTESEREDRETPGIKKSELIDWYLHQCVHEIASESELILKKQKCEKVINRLIDVDHLLMELQEDGTIICPDPTQRVSRDIDADPMIIINPVAEDVETNFLDQIST